MLPFAILAVAVLHDPRPDDIHRFGFAVRPLAESVPRRIWDTARSRVEEARRPISGYVLYGREHLYVDRLDDADYRERVWDAVDDLARECASPETRMCAARRLRERLGPVAYWLGELPSVDP